MFVRPSKDSRKSMACPSVQPWTQQNRKERATVERNRWYEGHHQLDCNALRLNDFLDATEKKNLCQEAMRLVQEAVEQEERMAAEYRKRTTLEEQQREQENRQRQLRDEIEANVKEREERLRTLREQQNRERKDFLDQKRLQQFMYNCDLIRPHLRQRLLEESKASQLKQIEDKEKQRQQQKNHENFWNEEASRGRRELEVRERIEEQLRNEREAKIICALDAQVETKNQQKATIHDEHAEERRVNDEKLREIKEIDKQQEAQRREKQLEWRNDLATQAAFKQQRKKQFEDMELAMEKKQAELIQNELELERANALLEKRSQREESDRYLEYLRNLRHDMAATEADRERMIDELRRKADEEAHQKREELKLQKKTMEREVYDAMWRKISENRERSFNEAKQRMQETMAMRVELQHNAIAEREAAERQRRDELEYGRDLKQQEQMIRQMRALELQNERALAEKWRQENEDYEAKANQLLQSNLNTIGMHPHFKAILKQQSKFRTK